MSLTHPSPSDEVSLVTDASNTHVGAALQQKESGGWRPQLSSLPSSPPHNRGTPPLIENS